MTAPTPENIQRWDPDLEYIGTGEYVPVLSKSDYGDAVMYEDHLRHLKLAQIAVLEEVLEGKWVIRDKIAALRLEVDP